MSSSIKTKDLKKDAGWRGSLSTLINLLNGVDEFCCCYHWNFACKACNYCEQLKIRLPPLIGWIAENSSFNEILEDKFKQIKTECRSCKAKDSVLPENIKVPLYCFIFLDENESQINLQKINYLECKTVKYTLAGIIMEQHSHFTSLVKSPIIKINGQFNSITGSFMHDGMRNDGNLLKIDRTITRCIGKAKPYVLLYHRL
ncbi:unnamed protein product [Blepharisma stoltei]|uniref:Uncharacterized protein n=1 Tax=Blepharisma stoltei TaxID=1481888 RepID=A0AAU9J182_9CILI|nr:unnamed protein product [Blepharisma stoltei]